jgi:hypothetical protein
VGKFGAAVGSSTFPSAADVARSISAARVLLIVTDAVDKANEERCEAHFLGALKVGFALGCSPLRRGKAAVRLLKQLGR